MKKVVEEHFQKHTVTEYQHIPDHGERKETSEFRNSKHELESVEHLGCFICGSMEQRESHHIFERCWNHAFDFQRVSYMLFNHYDYHGHCKRDFKSHEDLLRWFIEHFNGKYIEVLDEDGSPHTIVTCDDEALDTIYNQMILDKRHHRDEGHSAHGASFATFTGLTAAKPDFQIAYSPKEYEEIAKVHHDEKYGEVK
ncbi:hypothetical protein HPT25_23350 [Bacillus sp. BRMEA1]|uniref:hypothetical protein n=1 Tax=Neobacillus endophyticus TaxID=2738405 RepID=UPI0015659553|nr:hypothetical protein [Neobacillus endophyticus]NRD80262.1 hypothetical protein [Neobacillus endophyticus]